MFRKLRNRIILINLSTTATILVIAFSVIYLVAANNTAGRPKIQNEGEVGVNSYSESIDQYIEERLDVQHRNALNSLLVSLVVSGVCIELIVLLVSVYLAEQAIKPVKETYDAQKAFIANASHEIKTPLAVIQANLEAADIQGNQWIDNVAVKVEDLASLNNQLLTLARLEAAPETETREKVNLPELMAQLTGPLEPQVQIKQAKLSLDSKDLKKTTSELNLPALKQIVNILLDNAIKYCQKRIWVRLASEGGKTVIAVKNDGTTMSQEQLAHIFERFYQADKTKNGVGLGLAIAHQLAEANRWELTAESDKKTTTFKITL